MQTINLNSENWLRQSYSLLKDNHLIVLGEPNKLQWFATNLFQYLIQQGQCETSYWFGKLIHDLPDFCHQLCRSTPWGFEMGVNLNAIIDVLRGDGIVNQPNKYAIWFDASHLFNIDRKIFLSLYEIMLNMSWEIIQHGVNQKFIFLFPDTNEMDVRKLTEAKSSILVNIL